MRRSSLHTILLMILAVLATMALGYRLRQSAIEAWEDEAREASTRLTDTAMSWVSMLERDLRAIAVVYHASSNVSEDELLDAVDYLASGSSAIPLVSAAYAEKNADGRYVVRTSTDGDGVLSESTDLEAVPGMRDALRAAEAETERVHYTHAFTEYGSSVSTLALVSLPTDVDAVVISRLDLESLIEGLRALHVPPGLDVRFLESHYEGEPIEVVPPQATLESSLSFRQKVDRFQVVWWFEWHVTPDFQGGPNTSLATLATLSGVVLVLVLGLGFLSLIRQNARINAAVIERTRELDEARGAADRTRDMLVDAIESIDDAFVMYDSDEQLVITNQKYRDNNADVADVLVPGTPREAVLRAIYSRREHDDTPEEEWIAQRSDGFRQRRKGHLARIGDTWALMNTYETSDGGTVTLISDVTELELARETTEKAREEAEEAAREAEAANRAKSVFLANISHEIRTPLNAIQGFAEILSQRIDDPQLSEYLDSIESSATALLALINDILDLARTESGELEIAAREVSTIKLFDDLAQRHRPAAQRKGLDLKMILNPELPQRFQSDDKRLFQVLSNLIDNAVKFTDSGDVAVRAEHRPADKAGFIQLDIEVEDTGAGIPEDELGRIFGAFNQKSGQSINEYGGTGLGLALVHGLVEKMGGEVTVTSEVGVGSTFRTTFDGVRVLDPSPIGSPEDRGTASADELREETWSPSDLTEDTRARLPDLVTFLKSRVAVSEDLRSTLTINEVEAFAREMASAGSSHDYPPLRAWSLRLGRQAEQFDMDGIAETLDLFPQLVEATSSLAE